MAEVAEESKDPDCMLDRRVFNILLNAMGKNGEVHEALSMVQWLEDPTNSMDAQRERYARIFPPELTAKFMPDNYTYGTILSGLARTGDAEEAEAILETMKRRNITPNIVAYTNVIYALTGTSYPDKVARAYRVIEDAVSTQQQPDVVCIVAFLQVCANAEPEEHSLALELAVQAFESLDRKARTEAVYKAMARVFNNLVRDDVERRDLLKRLALGCCDQGYLSGAVLRELKFKSTSKDCTVLEWFNINYYRPKWSRRVSPDKRPKELIAQEKRRR
jgi:pentatricopeptide repeat protein